jgi:hypothetical protein
MSSNKFWNTGVNDQGALLQPKKPDGHWCVISGPGILNSNPPQPAYVLEDQKVGIYIQQTQPPHSQWIWANPYGMGDPSAPYVFQTKFYLEVDLSQHWIQIIGKWAADNFGHITIDGSPLPPGSGGGTLSLPPGNVFDNYNQWHEFSISQAHPVSLSQLHLGVGWHTLEISVNNEAPEDPTNPAGLNVSALGIVINPVHHFPDVVMHKP